MTAVGLSWAGEQGMAVGATAAGSDMGGADSRRTC